LKGIEKTGSETALNKSASTIDDDHGSGAEAFVQEVEIGFRGGTFAGRFEQHVVCTDGTALDLQDIQTTKGFYSLANCITHFCGVGAVCLDGKRPAAATLDLRRVEQKVAMRKGVTRLQRFG
jgi:hypothetical protein